MRSTHRYFDLVYYHSYILESLRCELLQLAEIDTCIFVGAGNIEMIPVEAKSDTSESISMGCSHSFPLLKKWTSTFIIARNC